MNLYFNTDQSVFFQDPTLANIAWRLVEGVPTSFEAMPIGPIVPSYNSGYEPEMLQTRLQLGDGYVHVSEAGIQSSRLMLSLNFNNRRPEVIKALHRFFLGDGSRSIYNRRPSEWFYYMIPPGFPREGEVRRFLATYSGSMPSYQASSLTVRFEESFQP